MSMERKKKKYSFMIKCCSLENKIYIRTCGRLFKWHRGSEIGRNSALLVLSTQPEGNHVIYRNAFRLYFPDCCLQGLFRKDCSLILSVTFALMGQLQVWESEGNLQRPRPKSGCMREIKWVLFSFPHCHHSTCPFLYGTESSMQHLLWL